MNRNDDLIINVRSQLHWYQRLTTDVCTAAMWGGWLYLWRPIVSLMAWLHGWGLVIRPATTKVATTTGGIVSMEGLMALAGGACMLMLWSLLPARKIKTQSHVSTVRECAEYFGMPESEIRSGRSTSVCVVHHDAEGRIVRIEARS